MFNSRERALVLRWSGNVLARVGADSPEALELADWLSANAGELGLGPAGDRAALTGSALATPAPPAHAAEAEIAQEDNAFRRLADLRAVVGLDARESAALELLLRAETQPSIQAMVDAVGGVRASGFSLREPTLGWLLGACPAMVQRLFRADGRLVRSGLVRLDEDQRLTLPRRLNRLAWSAGDADVRRLLLGGEGESELDWEDFEHLGAVRSDVEALIRGAAEQGAGGVNILVHGAPGTGKTVFCQTLAKHLGLALFSVGESGDGGREPLRSERLSELELAQSLLAADRRALLLFDETEDLLVSGGEVAFGLAPQPASGASRVFLHRLLERNPTPTLWTTHDAEALHPAVLRRMMYAVRMQAPPVSVRTRIWSRQLALHGIDATEDDAVTLAREFGEAPGLAAAATAAAHIGKGGLAAIRRGVKSLSAAMGHDLQVQRAAAEFLPDAGVDVAFDPSLIEADTDLVALADRLAEAESRAFSLCLQGPPGTGKTASLRYLAGRLGLDLAEVRGAELLGMWQGETERNIAEVFASAAEQGTFLVIDQAQALLAERHAGFGWETGAGEVLAWMERHPLPFACTARDEERLEATALRHFVFRCAFGFLGPATAARAYRLWFGRDLPADLRLPASLTLGEFRMVRRRAALLGVQDSDETLVAMLRDECRIAPPQGRGLGFGVESDRAFGLRRRSGAGPQPKARASASPSGRADCAPSVRVPNCRRARQGARLPVGERAVRAPKLRRPAVQ
ncbi:MAG: ATP-binding protein [Gammaproteobacteria bacterium]|nr:ATP-binding protein [Gammaproteobacteria bacterium]